MGEIENLTKPLLKSCYKYLHISNRFGYRLIIVRALTTFIYNVSVSLLDIYRHSAGLCGLVFYFNEEIYIIYENQNVALYLTSYLEKIAHFC